MIGTPMNIAQMANRIYAYWDISAKLFPNKAISCLPSWWIARGGGILFGRIFG